MFKKVSDLLGQSHYPKSKFSGRSKNSELFNFLDLIARWEEIVGPKLSKVTVPLKNQGKTLTILTNHSAYSQSLSMLEETLKAKIIKTFPQLRGKVQFFKFQVSTQHFDEQREGLLKRANIANQKVLKEKKQHLLHPQSPRYKALREEALQEFEGMEGDLLEQMVSLYIQNKAQE